MNRKIKFRAKHIHVMPCNEHLNGTWVYGYLADDIYIHSPDLEGEFLIDPNTVGQYIGIKDTNGKEIFEGDIIQRDIWEEKIIGEIAWGDMVGAGFYLKVKQKNGIGFYPMTKGRSDDDDGEMCNDIILGNIHDNPELLKR